MKIEPFGEIDLNSLGEYYEGEVSVDGRTVEVDLNFESETIGKEVLRSVESIMSNVKKYLDLSFAAISADFDLEKDSETAVKYLEHHKEILESDELVKVFGTTEISKEIFLNSLSAHRVGLYPEDEESFIVVDVGISREITDYLMAVTFNVEGKLSFISMES